MNKIYRIIRAWIRLALRIDRKLAKKRYSICVSCDQLKIGIMNKKAYSKCGVCSCPLIAKVRDYEESCPHPNGPKW